MMRTYIALIVCSVLNVVIGLAIAVPVPGILSLMYANYGAAADVLLAGSSTIFALTSFGAGFAAAWAAGENGELRYGVLSSFLCIVTGLLSLVLFPLPYLLVPLCVVSPIFAGLGGCCRKVLRRRQETSAPLDAGLQRAERL